MVTLQKWVDALKSGKYPKGKMTLRDYDNNFCCLGVFCDLVNSNAWNTNVGNHDYVWEDPQYPNSAESLDWFSAVAPQALIEDSFQWELIRLNDPTDSFDDVIERLENSAVQDPNGFIHRKKGY